MENNPTIEMNTFCGNYSNWPALKADYEDKIINPSDGDFYNILNTGGMIGEENVHANDTLIYSAGAWHIVHNHPPIQEAVVPQPPMEAPMELPEPVKEDAPVDTDVPEEDIEDATEQ